MPALERLDLDVEHWVENVERFGGLFHRVAGKFEHLREMARAVGQSWLQGHAGTRRLHAGASYTALQEALRTLSKRSGHPGADSRFIAVPGRVIPRAGSHNAGTGALAAPCRSCPCRSFAGAHGEGLTPRGPAGLERILS